MWTYHRPQERQRWRHQKVRRDAEVVSGGQCSSDSLGSTRCAGCVEHQLARHTVVKCVGHLPLEEIMERTEALTPTGAEAVPVANAGSIRSH